MAGRTLTQKIIADHLAGETDEEIELRVDQILLEDATGTMACLQFEQLGLDRVAVPTVSYVDHNVLQFDNKNPEDHAYLRSWAARYGALYSRPGNGIAHYLHLERFARPGQVLSAPTATRRWPARSGCSRSARARPRSRSRWPAGRIRSSGRVVVGVELRGRLAPWVQSKDVVLELLRRRGVRGGRGRIFEFHGDGVATLTATDRGTICNMVMETGATTGIFPSDEQTRAWLAAQGREDEFVELAADPGADVRRGGGDRSRRARAADRAAVLARERRAGARGRGHGDAPGLRRQLGELVVRGSRRSSRPCSAGARCPPSST